MSKKASSKKIYIAIILVAVLIIATVAVVYANSHSSKSPKAQIASGLQVGDTFTYNLTGTSILYSSDANPESMQPGFDGLNNTAFTITITNVNDTIVSYNSVMLLSNGTSSQYSSWVNISSGITNKPGDFWGIFPANLTIDALVNPDNPSGPTVYDVGNQSYSDSYRETATFNVAQNQTDTNDPTGNTMRQEIDNIQFDQATGMLTWLQDINEYNNPGMTLTTTWQLVYTSVWKV